MSNRKKKFITIIFGGAIILTLSGIAIINSGTLLENIKQQSNKPATSNEMTLKQDIIENPNMNKAPKTESEIKKEEIINNPTVPNSKSELSKEDQAVEYFETMQAEVETYTKTDSLKSKASNAFITITDFIFYGGEIKGVTYNQLSDSAKMKVLQIAKSMDNSISNKWPTYKEDIKTTSGKVYTTATSKISEGINYLDQKLENKFGDSYNDLKENAGNATEEIKDTAGDLLDAGKEQAGKAKEKIKDWYETFKEKNKSN